MSGFYTYLIASLPALHFENKPPFSFANFISLCQQFVSVEDFKVLQEVSLQPEWKEQVHQTIQKWQHFDTALRNELVKLRAAHLHISPTKFLRPDFLAQSEITHNATVAFRNPRPLEAERILDKARWDFLEEIAFGHYFDLDYLVIYAYKLSILEKWERVNSSDSRKLIEEVLSKN
ncbi:MAG: DUF2764 family protein [Candidatus Omnitrophica bacterium]|nr:DUF2764 family protein [Candidatus Omnitrophota bacterium]MDD5237820.1 DUF2764 family protein [Candidatus Omnitrophota bacterium]